MTQLLEVLRRVRELNVEALSRAIDAEVRPFVEPAYRMADGSIAVEGPLDLPLRADLIRREEDTAGDEIQVDPARSLEFEPILFQMRGAEVRVEAFGWDYAEILADVPESADLSPLQEWFMSWFDAEDASTPDETGLYRVVHFMSDPEYDDHRLAFIVDFGSAPVDAWVSLMERLVELGAKQIITRRATD
ncbi:MAG: hypothetical protein H6718_19180 [Polyangiaceae bacterium]|nr:hypothetical protein [Myxococcales bacterium]MCB9587533.1 hypothetical protein [Polyangiaceae bacterium]MCB9605670.1 hypothetical protein [Polyangiaceae bacterium]